MIQTADLAEWATADLLHFLVELRKHSYSCEEGESVIGGLISDVETELGSR